MLRSARSTRNWSTVTVPRPYVRWVSDGISRSSARPTRPAPITTSRTKRLGGRAYPRTRPN
ncbi:hypothetical protein FEK34_02370 [Nocardia cyriacigeorgica]|uniref:Uncharacterized protein n=1 Tax=Nocardia cyriacigeorgica TaxID=135487 RepID=A0A5R8P1N0_9NOCA|nr:hypothetical protein FEK34_02370 [Nocardia cyriacigeorgica]